MMPTVLLKMVGRCAMWGCAIEIPILAWFLLVQDQMHVSAIPGILFALHLPSYYLTSILLGPLKARVSAVEYNWLATSLMGCLQAAIIGMFFFLAGLKKNYWDS